MKLSYETTAPASVVVDTLVLRGMLHRNGCNGDGCRRFAWQSSNENETTIRNGRACLRVRLCVLSVYGDIPSKTLVADFVRMLTGDRRDFGDVSNRYLNISSWDWHIHYIPSNLA